MTKQEQIQQLEKDWKENSRWDGVKRPYTAEDVVKLRGSLNIEHTIAKTGSMKLWEMLKLDEPVTALGAVTGNQAIQEVQAGLKAIYCSGWQVAGDNNSDGTMYPDQSLYPVDSVPKLVEKINNALIRTDEIYNVDGKSYYRMAQDNMLIIEMILNETMGMRLLSKDKTIPSYLKFPLYKNNKPNVDNISCAPVANAPRIVLFPLFFFLFFSVTFGMKN